MMEDIRGHIIKRSGGRANRLAVLMKRPIMKRPSADDCQEWFANHLMLRGMETSLVVSDKEKRGQTIPVGGYCRVEQLNQLLKPRKGNYDVKTGQLRLCPLPSAADALITGCITSGVKLARLQYRRLYGTREVALFQPDRITGGESAKPASWRVTQTVRTA